MHSIDQKGSVTILATTIFALPFVGLGLLAPTFVRVGFPDNIEYSIQRAHPSPSNPQPAFLLGGYGDLALRADGDGDTGSSGSSGSSNTSGDRDNGTRDGVGANAPSSSDNNGPAPGGQSTGGSEGGREGGGGGTGPSNNNNTSSTGNGGDSGAGQAQRDAQAAAQQQAASEANYRDALTSAATEAVRAAISGVSLSTISSMVRAANEVVQSGVVQQVSKVVGTSLSQPKTLNEALNNIANDPNAARHAQDIGDRLAAQTGMKDVDPGTPGLQINDPELGKVTVTEVETLPPEDAPTPEITSPFNIPPGYDINDLTVPDEVANPIPGTYAPSLSYTKEEAEALARMAQAEVGVLRNELAYQKVMEAAVNNAILNNMSVMGELSIPNRYQVVTNDTINAAPADPKLVEMAEKVLQGTLPRQALDNFGNPQYNFANISLTNAQVAQGLTRQKTADAWNRMAQDPSSQTLYSPGGSYETTFGNLGGVPAKQGLVAVGDVDMPSFGADVGPAQIGDGITNPAAGDGSPQQTSNPPASDNNVDLTGGVDPRYGVKDGEIPKPTLARDAFDDMIRENPKITVKPGVDLKNVDRRTLVQINRAVAITGRTVSINAGFADDGHVSHDDVIGEDGVRRDEQDAGTAVDLQITDDTSVRAQVDFAKTLSALGAKGIGVYSNTPGLIHVDNLSRRSWSSDVDGDGMNRFADAVKVGGEIANFAKTHVQNGYVGFKGITGANPLGTQTAVADVAPPSQSPTVEQGSDDTKATPDATDDGGISIENVTMDPSTQPAADDGVISLENVVNLAPEATPPAASTPPFSLFDAGKKLLTQGVDAVTPSQATLDKISFAAKYPTLARILSSIGFGTGSAQQTPVREGGGNAKEGGSFVRATTTPTTTENSRFNVLLERLRALRNPQ